MLTHTLSDLLCNQCGTIARTHVRNPSEYCLKVIYHPLYGVNNYVLIWGDWLLCDPLRGSHDSQSPHIWGCLTIMRPSERVT